MSVAMLYWRAIAAIIDIDTRHGDADETLLLSLTLVTRHHDATPYIGYAMLRYYYRARHNCWLRFGYGIRCLLPWRDYGFIVLGWLTRYVITPMPSGLLMDVVEALCC